MTCHKKDCGIDVEWTGRIVIGDLVVEINLCGDHFQEFY